MELQKNNKYGKIKNIFLYLKNALGVQPMQYDVCFSFAGEDRDYVEQVAYYIRHRGISVFYDNFNQVELWGKDLYVHLDEIYRRKSRYCVIFASTHYINKLWPDHERRSAQARAISEHREYILPARFDDTEIPGILPTIGYIDLREFNPKEFAEIIFEKVSALTTGSFIDDSTDLSPQYAFFSDDLLIPELQWPSNSVMNVNSSFQLIPVSYESKQITDVIEFLLDCLNNLFNKSGNYWTYSSDRIFDRVYATTSSLTFLFQLGMTDNDLIVKNALEFLDQFSQITLENRASIFFKIAFHRIEESKIIEFLKMLQTYQYTEKSSPMYGSFLLPQGDDIISNRNTNNWQQQRYHNDGATFHACHIADNLLHIQSNYIDARREAKLILDGIRNYLFNSFKNHSGFLLNYQFQPSNMTLFGYALSKPLHIALPKNWLDCVNYCVKKLNEESNMMTRCLGVMNLYYLCRMNNTVELREMSYEHVSKELEFLWTQRDLFSSNARDVSILGRCFLYGYRLLNYDAGAYILNAVRNYKWERGK